jgi:hypothetical protein
MSTREGRSAVGEQAEVREGVAGLLELARLDTVYGDLHRERAAALLATVLPEDEARILLHARGEADGLAQQLPLVVEAEAWEQVRHLSGRLADLRRLLEGRGALLQLADRLQPPGEPPVDPFSPGLAGLAGLADGELEAQRQRAERLLLLAAQADPAAGSFYAARRAALARLGPAGTLVSAARPGGVAASERQALKADVQAALRSGDLERLGALSAQLMRRPAAGQAGSASEAGGALAGGGPPTPLTYRFPAEVLGRAERLGLGPIHVPSARHRVEDLYRLAWMPADTAPGGEARVRLPVAFPDDAPAPLRELLELYMRRPFLNSGGARDLPPLVEEDALVETFDDPAPDQAVGGPLLEALGLAGRRALSRVRIEAALAEHGLGAVRGLGLDPVDFCLVCIPGDLHVRIGRERGWGSQPIWTHLDGHMVMPGRRFLALAGGDVRFGGVYDLVGIGRDYDAERLVARFAVVQRRRQAAW